MKKSMVRQSFYSYIFITLLLICLGAKAQTQINEKLKDESLTDKKFLPHMAVHMHQGCPENSICSKKTGKKYLSWTRILKKHKKASKLDQFRKKTGIPINAWLTNINNPPKEHIIWDSACHSHNKKGNIIKELVIFKKKILADGSGHVHFDDLYLLQNKSAVTRYKIPRNEKPIYIDGKSLVFLKEENGKYYGLKVEADKKFKIADTKSPETFPYQTACPQILKEKFQAQRGGKTLYRGFRCQKIWNAKSKKEETIMYGFACF